MARILFLAHRIPYPPNKGDKIRSWNFLQHLCRSHEVHAGFFIDHKDDLRHLDFMRKTCASITSVYAAPLYQKFMALRGLLLGKSLTECAYPSKRIRKHIDSMLRDKNIDLVFAYSAAPYAWLPRVCNDIPLITDLVDVDSAKWAAYAEKSRFPLNWLYAREAKLLAKFEMDIATTSSQTLFVSDDEAALFKERFSSDSDARLKIHGVQNGVDCTVFKPQSVTHVDRHEDVTRLIFTGAMDYAPNIEAVIWFAENVLPLLSDRQVQVELVVAGGPVSASVNALERLEGVKVMGRVADMAAVIDDADIVIAPLQTARGIQNKVLEGMAMAKPVIATSAANEGINAPDNEAIIIANTPQAFAERICHLIENKDTAQSIGNRARQYVKKNFSWQASWRLLDDIIETTLSATGRQNNTQ